MPRHQPVDEVAVLAVYQETGSNRETARRLGLHENTVLKVRRRQGGHCDRCGKPLDDPNYSNCSECRAWAVNHEHLRRQRRKAAGLCLNCDQPALEGMVRCAHHAELSRAKKKRLTQAARERLGEERFLELQRDAARKTMYGVAGTSVWERAGHHCEVCGAPFQKRKLHIHHIDGNRQHGAEENLIVLCKACHVLVHDILWHPNLPAILAWIKRTYPAAKLD